MAPTTSTSALVLALLVAVVALAAQPAAAQAQPCLTGLQLNTTGLANFFFVDELASDSNSRDTVCCNTSCSNNPSSPATCNVGGSGNSCSSFPSVSASSYCLSADKRTLVDSGVRPSGMDHGSAFFKSLHCPSFASCCTNVTITASFMFDSLADSPIPDCSVGGSDTGCAGASGLCTHHPNAFFAATDGVRYIMMSVGLVTNATFFNASETPNTHYFELHGNDNIPCDHFRSENRGIPVC